MTRRLRVLVVEDGATLRDALVRMLGADPRLEVVGEAGDGARAVALARTLAPDVITMDVELPGMDGLQAIARIMAECPARIIVVSAHATDRAASLGFRAISAGALDVVPKPDGTVPLPTWGRRLADTVALMAEIPVPRRFATPSPVARSMRSATAGARVEVAALGIAASTGGPAALEQILSRVPEDLPFPILIAQHLADGFAPRLASWLESVGRIPVRLASEGAVASPGTAWLAPDGRDLSLAEGGALSVPPATGMARPNADSLLTAIARVHGPRGAGLVLTGMGTDGAEGLLALRRAGGLTLAQDEASCVVWGMPRAAAENGAAQEVLALFEIAPRIRAMGRP